MKDAYIPNGARRELVVHALADMLIRSKVCLSLSLSLSRSRSLSRRRSRSLKS